MELQCDESIGQCWCTDPGTGKPIPGTRRNGMANCKGTINSVSFQMQKSRIIKSHLIHTVPQTK